MMNKNFDIKKLNNPSSEKNSEKKRYSSLNFFATALVLIITGFVMQIFVSSILSIINFYAPKLLASYNSMVEKSFSPSNGALRVITVILFSPICEELVFRGPIFLFLRKNFLSGKKSRIFAVLITSLFFGLYHGNVVQFCYGLASGIILAVITIWFSSLIPAMILHICVNASAYLISFGNLSEWSFFPIMLTSLAILVVLITILNILSKRIRRV